MNRRELLLLSLAAAFVDYRSSCRWKEGLHEVHVKHISLRDMRRIDKAYLKKVIASVKEQGILEHLFVSIQDDGKLKLLDGAYRLLAAKELGIKKVPCHLRANEMLILESWPKPAVRVVSDPKTYAKQLQKVMDVNGLTKGQLAEKLGRTTQWLEERLSV